MKALMVAGDRSGSGKTSITLGLASILSRQHRVQTFKVGMDYIDPSYLSAASGRPCRNLDGFVMNSREIQAITDHAAAGADLLLVEGVRGLYEGADALTDQGSSAEIAKLLNIPVVLVVNARSITRSAAALVKGFQLFDPAITIQGVILNNVHGSSHREKAVKAIEHACGVPVLGAIPHEERMALEMRHLGLVPYREGERSTAFTETVGGIRKVVEEHVDVERLLSCAREYQPRHEEKGVFSQQEPLGITLGIAFDEAFNFYYADLFDLIPALGATYRTFSPVHDRLPEADGYLLGGGYPELFGRELEENDAMREGMREVSEQGRPIYAECGGLMYLTDMITLAAGWRGGEKKISYEMCGVFPGTTRMPARRVVSYVEGTACSEGPLGGGGFRGHEFHYSDVDLSPETAFCYTLSRGVGIHGNQDGALLRKTLGSYTHLSPVPARSLFSAFVQACQKG